VRELRSPGGFTRLMLRMPALIQEETRLVTLAEAMAERPAGACGGNRAMAPSKEVEAA